MAPLRATRTNSWTATYVFQLIVNALVWISQNPLIFLQPNFYIPVCNAVSVFTFYLVEKGKALCQDRLSENDASSSSECRNGHTKNSFIPSDYERQDEGVKSTMPKGDSALESDTAKPAERSSNVRTSSFDFPNRLSLFVIQDIITLLGDLRSKKTNIVAGKDDAGDISPWLNFSSSWDADKPGTSSKEGIRLRFGEGDTNLHVPWTGKETMKIPKEHDWVVTQEESLTLKTSSCESVIVGLPIREPSDTGSTQNKTNASSKSGNQTPPAGGRPSPQAEGHYESISYSGNSSGSGGDDGDGDDKKKQSGRIGGCQGNDSDDVDKEDKSKQVPKEQGLEYGVDKNGDDSGGSEEYSGETQRTGDSQGNGAQSLPQPSSSYSTVPGGSVESFTQKNGKSSCPNSPKKAAHLGLRIDVMAAEMEVQGRFAPSETQVESEEICKSESVKDLQRPFTCRRNLNSDKGWQKCTDSFCQLIQYLLYHSQNCRMHVLGGCEDCIRYKDILINHVSKCTLPLGQCVVARCDYIREYMCMIKSPLPGNRKWTWALDRLFFRSTPPTTPTIEDSEEFLDGYREVLAGLAQAHTQEDTVYDTHKDIIVAGESSASNGELSPGADGWNQYHVDRPPDAQVTRGPVIQESGQLECEEYSLSAPLSAADVSVKNACANQNVGSAVVEEQDEIIWPLNQVG
ncbi:hypothetical protein AWC38_SpisGene19536 [Stylophora pistillata]|uniref:TAZ-type domain-containing protein n=2 Tax=Stylophora pistillata TaxID=50429 RepID=A0A2B4RCY5_STYPI|nr:hypothetical protein AWC38_SpisGene19536 [Stylophora pistillata]